MRSFLVFRLGPEEFAADINNVVEIFKSQKTHEVPEIKDYIVGVINVRGKVVALVDLRKRFGLEPSPDKERTVLVKTSTESLALIVDEVVEILELEDEEISKPPTIFKGLASEYLEGLGKREDRVMVILDLEKVLSAEDALRLDIAGKTAEDAE
ncbi:MAG: chemotaxis protein CheW [Nitrospirota bacterium]|jgi:purine-binding chemotaxis protein CheW